MPTITLYTKPNCPLCDHARYALQTLLADRRTTAEGVRHLEEAAPTIPGARLVLQHWRDEAAP